MSQEIIESGGKVKEPAQGSYFEEAVSAEIDYLSGRMNSQSVRVNGLGGKATDAASNLSSLLQELHSMVNKYFNKMGVHI